MKIKNISALLVAALFTLSNANAQVAKKMKNQHQRIKQGVQTGEITKAEAVNLRNDQKDIRQDVKTAHADGTVTRQERKDIRQQQQLTSAKIYQKKHNGRTRN